MAPKSTAAAPQAIGEFIDIGLLSPSPTNPRKRFYDNTLEELAGSIRAEGIIEPLIVRVSSAETQDGASIYEIVCGEIKFALSDPSKITLRTECHQIESPVEHRKGRRRKNENNT